jgi:hypothetical protein
MADRENRKHVRISISVPVSCISLDEAGSPLNFNMGVVTDVSQSGVALEVVCRLESEIVLLSFFDVGGKPLELKGKSAYSKQTDSGTIRVGVMLLGNQMENIYFVKELVRFHHYTKKLSSTNK